MIDNYLFILDGHEPVEAKDYLAWAKWFEDSLEIRIIAQTRTDADELISTVFLGVNHDLPRLDGTPLLFETFIFGKTNRAGVARRYETWDRAEAGHWEVVKELADIPSS